MPTMAQAAMNPNDLGAGGYQKKQFKEMNQHVFHHNAVLPHAGTLDGSGRKP